MLPLDLLLLPWHWIISRVRVRSGSARRRCGL